MESATKQLNLLEHLMAGDDTAKQQTATEASQGSKSPMKPNIFEERKPTLGSFEKSPCLSKNEMEGTITTVQKGSTRILPADEEGSTNQHLRYATSNNSLTAFFTKKTHSVEGAAQIKAHKKAIQTAVQTGLNTSKPNAKRAQTKETPTQVNHQTYEVTEGTHTNQPSVHQSNVVAVSMISNPSGGLV